MLVTISKILLIINIAMIMLSILIGEIAGMFLFGLFAALNIITIYFDKIVEDIISFLDKLFRL